MEAAGLIEPRPILEARDLASLELASLIRPSIAFPHRRGLLVVSPSVRRSADLHCSLNRSCRRRHRAPNNRGKTDICVRLRVKKRRDFDDRIALIRIHVRVFYK